MDKGLCRVVVDTNLWISFLIGRRLGDLLDVLDHPEIELVSTPLLKEECLRVAARPKFRRYFPKDAVEELDAWMELHMLMVDIQDVPLRCRDPKDDYLLELAVKAEAVYLVSGDEDLLTLGKVEGCRIMTFAQFLTDFYKTH